jgi:hypothetical protein
MIHEPNPKGEIQKRSKKEEEEKDKGYISWMEVG